MNWQANIKIINRKECIFCDWRHKFVRLTPEEWVRQNFLHFLVDDMHYPQARIAVEHQIEVGMTTKRCDAVVMNDTLEPLCIIEFKAETIVLTNKVFDQVAVYNHQLRVPYFIVSNGKTTYFCEIKDSRYEFLRTIPAYNQLWRS